MMIRVLLLLLVGASVALRALEPILVQPIYGASASVKQPHVVAELIPEAAFLLAPDDHFDVILHLQSDPGWHTYWVNPGDAGLATTIKWTLPDGFTAGPIQWPTPEKHNMGPLVTYGYEGDVYLITTITFPKNFIGKFQIKAKANWLVCQEECIPGKGEFVLDLDRPSAFAGNPGLNAELFEKARARLPFVNQGWDVTGAYGTPPELGGKGRESLEVMFKNKHGRPETGMGNLQFFPEQSNVLDAQAKQTSSVGFPTPANFNLWIPLVQNGEKPEAISGVLVSDVSLVGEATGGDRHAVYIPAFSTKGVPNEIQQAQPWLIAVLGAAFVGGLILNLMPCVLPVLSLKVFSLTKHAGSHPHSAWKQGVAFTVGVVLSFWVLAGVLLVLKAAGNQLGWGFQMQSPGFVLTLIFIFFLLALNLFGVFELGTSLVGLDAKVTGRGHHGMLTSFLNGALATLAATPCTAPFMGSSVGFAAQQPPFVAMLIFTFLALGMAAPYLLLTIFPAALKFVPKPGAWMESFKQFMGFLLMATVIFLLYVLGALIGEDKLPYLLGLLLLTSLAAWIYGRWGNVAQSLHSRIGGAGFAFVILLLTVSMGIGLTNAPLAQKSTRTYVAGSAPSLEWMDWSQEAVQKAVAEGKPVFVDFTAAWCLSCKVNERVALDTDAVRKAFADKGVVLFKADWTHSDPEISKALQQYNRDGVPLYLLYSPKQPNTPQVLPEVLTPGIVLDALGKI